MIFKLGLLFYGFCVGTIRTRTILVLGFAADLRARSLKKLAKTALARWRHRRELIPEADPHNLMHLYTNLCALIPNSYTPRSHSPRALACSARVHCAARLLWRGLMGLNEPVLAAIV